MVVHTDTCYFSELKIYPGRGVRCVRKDGRLLAFALRKCVKLFNQRKKAQKVHWTQAWRRLHRKGAEEEAAKKKIKKSTKVFKAIAGLSIDELKKRRTMKPEQRKAEREALARATKEKTKKVKDEKKKTGVKVAQTKVLSKQGFVKIPKSRKTLASAKH